MARERINRRELLADSAAALAAAIFVRVEPTSSLVNLLEGTEVNMNGTIFTKGPAPKWLLDMWKEIDDKTFGKGFDCFTKDAICNLGVADWHGREAIRANLRAFIDTGLTTHHDVTEYWDGGSLKVFRGIVTMIPEDKTKKTVRPTMVHFFYMDETDPTKVNHWHGAVGPTAFG